MAEPATPRARRVLAPNPGPMTLDGTNTWLLSEPGSASVLVVDPGPKSRKHLHAVATEVAEAGQRVSRVLLTHGHPDHSAGARLFAEMVGATVAALDPRHRLGEPEGLHDGDVVTADGLEVHVLATPGHSADHLCFVLPADDAVLTGDHVLGRGTSVVAHPDGRMGPYLESLRRLAEVGASTLLPGHGPVLPDAAGVIAYYIAHRAERQEQVLTALRAGARTPREIVERVYVDVDKKLHRAAEMSVRALLEMLVEQHRVTVDGAGRHALVGTG
jgi:glyoxylase-like metal-dependent hydrolase (beta-lactamase superfamily II)